MPPSIGTIHPRTDQTVGLDYRFFREVNHELADRGFLTTSAESLVTWAALCSCKRRFGGRARSSDEKTVGQMLRATLHQNTQMVGSPGTAISRSRHFSDVQVRLTMSVLKGRADLPGARPDFRV